MFGLLRTHPLVFEGCREVGGGVSSFAFAPEHGSALLRHPRPGSVQTSRLALAIP
jgi:hypothetical protein